MKLDGRTAVITGAGSGMGRAMAQIFHAEGANIVAADIDEAAATETVNGLDGRAIAVGVDVSDVASV
ncbi:MAG TPA: SDR family NAD(P)-dependent oxidoreductase, partial [Capillimicrobium sp.]|nr:SDR family NAD(P)-dependent oxidoreductase [Capillimicrobium sp.]